MNAFVSDSYLDFPLTLNQEIDIKNNPYLEKICKGSDRTVYIFNSFVIKESAGYDRLQNREEVSAWKHYQAAKLEGKIPKVDLAAIYRYSSDQRYIIMERCRAYNKAQKPYEYIFIDGCQIGINQSGQVVCYYYGTLYSMITNRSYRLLLGL